MEENKKSKSELLTEKCNKLVEKFEKEKSPIKRALYSVKFNILIAKIEKELEIQKIQENYGVKREEINDKFSNDRKKYRKEIAELVKMIRSYQNKLAMNTKYDPDSKEFLYPKSEIEREGGIDDFIDSLRDDDDFGSKDLADIIEATLEDRRILDEMQEKLAKKQNSLEKLDNIRKNEIKKSEKEEKALIRKEKIGIFQSIKKLFEGMIAGYIEKRNTMKQINEFEEKEITEIKEKKKSLKEDAKSEYEKACQEAYEKYLEAVEGYKAKYFEEKEKIDEENKNKETDARKFANDLRMKVQNEYQKESAKRFKEQLRNLTDVQENPSEGEGKVEETSNNKSSEEKHSGRIVKGGYVDKDGTFHSLGNDGRFEIPKEEEEEKAI